jgi:adenylate cyclase
MLPQAGASVLTEPCNLADKGCKLADIACHCRPAPEVAHHSAASTCFNSREYTLDVLRSSLRTADRDVQLRPKAFEVLRYLVENADRLVTKEELIQTIWPNVIVTDEVLTHCVSEARQAIGDGDQAIIKTVPRRGYRFAAAVSRIIPNAERPPSGPAEVKGAPSVSDAGGRLGLPLSDRPSVAVLPFANLSDPQQDYFSDGITEDIITELSRFSELLVIARNSSFQYKGKAVDIRQAAQELGARYVLEGSVRRSGDHVRITAQLVDAVTGVHRWAERYDRELHDVFAVQDEVARAIVALLVAHVKRAETERAMLKPPASWEAHDCYLRGAEAFSLHSNSWTKASLHDARRLFEQSLAIDPGYARAAAMLSWTHQRAYVEPLDGDYLSPAALDRAVELAKAAVRLDPRLPQARAQLGYVLIFKRQHDAALAEFERAFALNPNFTDDRFAQALIYAGQPARAIEVLEANMRLDPFPSPIYSSGMMGSANYMLKRYGEAVRWFLESTLRLPDVQWPHTMLASAYAQFGQLEEARKEAAEVLRINPDFTIEGYKRIFAAHKDPKDAEHRIDGMRKAGLPET